MNKTTYYLLILVFITTLIITGCAVKRPYFDPIIDKPKNVLTEPNKKKNKKLYKQYKKELDLLQDKWEDLNEGLNEMRSAKFDNAINYFSHIIKTHQTEKYSYNEYYNAALYFTGLSYFYKYNFTKTNNFFNKIPKDSVFYPYALKKATLIVSDTDKDSYSDAIEFLKGYSPDNPYSHP